MTNSPPLCPAGRTGKKRGGTSFPIVYTAGAVGAYFYYFDLYVNFTKVFCGDPGRGGAVRRAPGPALPADRV